MQVIINDEKETRDRVSRLLSKSLTLTQIEDKAVQELEIFYNVAEVTDERITVSRSTGLATVAPPVWPVHRPR